MQYSVHNRRRLKQTGSIPPISTAVDQVRGEPERPLKIVEIVSAVGADRR